MSETIIYEIHVRGLLDQKWEGLFSPLRIIPMQHETLITGPVPDQAALFGILTKIRDSGMHLVSIAEIPGDGTITSQAQSAFPRLTSERLLMREFSLVDIPAVYDIFSRAEVARWINSGQFEHMEQAELRLKERMNLFKKQIGCRWAIALREAPLQVIGSCGYFHVRLGTRTYELGYDLHPDFWRQGLMSEALQTLVHFSFSAHSPFSIHRFEALVAPENAASIHILEKLGFTREGLRREFGFWKNRYQDVWLYSLLNHNTQPKSDHFHS